ncbi:hypothetical protein ACFQX6_07915 [Streptosporangium lutulentum]
MTTPAIEDLLRELAPQVLGALIRRNGQFEGARTPYRRPSSPPPCSGRSRECRTTLAAGW